MMIHVHPEDRRPISRSSPGTIVESAVQLNKDLLATASHFEIEVS
jgi:hypothetical protein